MRILKFLGKMVPYMIVGVLLATTSATASMVTYKLSNAPTPKIALPEVSIDSVNMQLANMAEVAEQALSEPQSVVEVPVEPAPAPVVVKKVVKPVVVPAVARPATTTPVTVVATTTPAQTLPVMTASDIASHNTASSCYVAVNGIVYDVTNTPSWRNCTHHGATGGKDISASFPHPTTYLNSLIKVGTYDAGANVPVVPVVVPQPTPQATTPTIVFSAAMLQTHNTASSCYVAFSGIVYDVTNNSVWTNCAHHGINGGRDLTAIFPHPASYVATLTRVGTYDANAGTNVTTNTNTQTNTNTNTQTNTNTASTVFSTAMLQTHNTASSCYVAFSGNVYDVTNNSVWTNCSHHGINGGRDLTNIFPHPTSYLATLTKVGTYDANAGTNVASNTNTNTQTNNNTTTNNNTSSGTTSGGTTAEVVAVPQPAPAPVETTSAPTTPPPAQDPAPQPEPQPATVPTPVPQPVPVATPTNPNNED